METWIAPVAALVPRLPPATLWLPLRGKRARRVTLPMPTGLGMTAAAVGSTVELRRPFRFFPPQPPTDPQRNGGPDRQIDQDRNPAEHEGEAAFAAFCISSTVAMRRQPKAGPCPDPTACGPRSVTEAAQFWTSQSRSDLCSSQVLQKVGNCFFGDESVTNESVDSF